MASLPPQEFDEEELSIAEELARVDAEQNEIRIAVGQLQQEADNFVKYPIERLRAGVGRWLTPKKKTLEAHFEMVQDRALDIDFSPANYPGFDAIFTEKYEGKGFFDPEHANFPKYEPLRDNLATVRNAILVEYFPDNGTQDPQRIKQLKEISEFLAEGLNNDKAYFGLIPVHNPFKPFIDVELANAPNGEGARYLYSKILEMQRHSNWTRPFDAVTALLSGTSSGWGLLALEDSVFAKDQPDASEEQVQQDVGERIGALATLYDRLEEHRAALRERVALRDKAQDLDTIANQLLFTFYNIRDAVSDLAQPIKREAIDIAHEILNKLKVSMGSTTINAGIKLPLNEDTDALGAISGVGRVLQRMIGFLRSAGDDALSIPAIALAHRSLGELAYAAKMGAYNTALRAGDGKMVSRLREQLEELKGQGLGASGLSIGDLLGNLQQGVEALSSRMNAIGIKTLGVGITAPNADAVQAMAVGTGSGSQQQAMNQLQLQQNKAQQDQSTNQQRGQTTAQMGQAQQVSNRSQQAMQQLQQVQQQMQPQGQPQGFSPVMNTPRASNGIQAQKQARNMRKTVNAQIQKAMITPTPPPQADKPVMPVVKPPAPAPTKMLIDPSLVAGLGTSLNQAQTAADALTTGSVGPRSAHSAIAQAKAGKTAQQQATEASMEQYEQQLLAQRGNIPPQGRGR